jgi:hypothetical protein
MPPIKNWNKIQEFKTRDYGPGGDYLKDQRGLYRNETEPVSIEIGEATATGRLVRVLDTSGYDARTVRQEEFDSVKEAKSWAVDWMRDHPYPDV